MLRHCMCICGITTVAAQTSGCSTAAIISACCGGKCGLAVRAVLAAHVGWHCPASGVVWTQVGVLVLAELYGSAKWMPRLPGIVLIAYCCIGIGYGAGQNPFVALTCNICGATACCSWRHVQRVEIKQILLLARVGCKLYPLWLICTGVYFLRRPCQLRRLLVRLWLRMEV